MATNESPITHNEAAFRLRASLRTLQGTIDGFVMPPTPLDRQSQLAAQRGKFPDAFFLALAIAIESSTQLAEVIKARAIALTPDDIRDMLRYGEAYLPLAVELERFARAIRYTVGLRRSKVGVAASAVYTIAKGLNLLGDLSLPVPEVDSMRRAFGTRRRKAAQAPASAPVPVTPKSP